MTHGPQGETDQKHFRHGKDAKSFGHDTEKGVLRYSLQAAVIVPHGIALRTTGLCDRLSADLLLIQS
jgi:hypothetical protein